jgi:protein FAM50
MAKRATVQERLEEAEAAEQHQAELAAQAEREKRKREKKTAKPKLSFALDVSDATQAGRQAGGSSAGRSWGCRWLPCVAGVAGARGAPAGAALQDDEDEAAAEEEPPPRASSGAGASTSAGGGEEAAAKKQKFGKMGKNPTVSTEFLPDKDREKEETALRQQLKKVGRGQPRRACPGMQLRCAPPLVARTPLRPRCICVTA